ncbi:MAG TPA: ornithine carbamoyltransferase [Acidobacteriota bacterium]|jgi:ornithine carbamoyltransferase
MKPKHFISLSELSGAELDALLDLSARIKAEPQRFATALQGQVLAMIFEKPSLRTRATFEIGMLQMGGHALYLTNTEIGLGKREAIKDVARNLSRWAQAIMARTFAHETVLELAEHASIPVINGLTNLLHPCQALADLFTLREKKGRLAGLKLAFVGDGNNVAHSLMLAGARSGMHVTVVCHPSYKPDPRLTERAERIALETGARIEVSNDLAAGLAQADAIYADVFASMGFEAEREERLRALMPYQVNAAVMRLARPDAVFLHCLPAHRGEEVTEEVLEGPQSVVFDQAENRLHAQKALLVSLMAGG